jgi:hypothetical protein
VAPFNWRLALFFVLSADILWMRIFYVLADVVLWQIECAAEVVTQFKCSISTFTTQNRSRIVNFALGGMVAGFFGLVRAAARLTADCIA